MSDPFRKVLTNRNFIFNFSDQNNDIFRFFGSTDRRRQSHPLVYCNIGHQISYRNFDIFTNANFVSIFHSEAMAFSDTLGPKKIQRYRHPLIYLLLIGHLIPSSMFDIVTKENFILIISHQTNRIFGYSLSIGIQQQRDPLVSGIRGRSKASDAFHI
jgi:hypothetical protein